MVLLYPARKFIQMVKRGLHDRTKLRTICISKQRTKPSGQYLRLVCLTVLVHRPREGGLKQRDARMSDTGEIRRV